MQIMLLQVVLEDKVAQVMVAYINTIRATAKTTSACRIITISTSGGFADTPQIAVSRFSEIKNEQNYLHKFRWNCKHYHPCW